jgi:hypothetical protein
MKTGVGLAFICAGAILAFAVTTNTSVFNLHTAGWVIMLVGIIGLLIPRRTYGWLGRRLVRRTYPVTEVEEVTMPGYVAREPGAARVRAGLPTASPGPGTSPGGGATPGATPRATPGASPADEVPGATVVVPGATVRPAPPAQTEVIEDYYEE